MKTEQLIEAYRRMLRIRRFEERVSELYRDSEIPGFVHVSIGQEGSAVGVCMGLKPEDYLTTTHRGHGHCLARGMAPGRMMAELLGRSDGYGGGLGGSMHIADPESGVIGANGIVGAGLPIAVGAGVTCLQKGEGIAVAMFGEGAATTGAFHESVNLACVWELPVLFVCENNGYAEFSPWESLSRAQSVVQLASGYDIHAETCRRGDIDEVFEVATGAIGRVRTGGGPVLLEIPVSRFHGHYEGDPQAYRATAELEAAADRDVILRARRLLANKESIAEGVISALETEVEHEIDMAVDFARASAYPEPTDG